MSKYVKDLVSKDISKRLEGVDDALLVNVIGMDANLKVSIDASRCYLFDSDGQAFKRG